MCLPSINLDRYICHIPGLQQRHAQLASVPWVCPCHRKKEIDVVRKCQHVCQPCMSACHHMSLRHSTCQHVAGHVSNTCQHMSAHVASRCWRCFIAFFPVLDTCCASFICVTWIIRICDKAIVNESWLIYVWRDYFVFPVMDTYCFIHISLVL